MFGFLKKKEVFLCPVDGKILPISEVNDPVFSQEMMGPGFAVVPTSKVVVVPMDGEVVTVFPTSHAFGIKSKNGIEMIIHIGIDTVELNGKGFKPLVKQGDVVAILGPSGSGKTTMLRCVNFLEHADGGSLIFDGKEYPFHNISKKDIAAIRQKTAFVFQNYNLFLNKTALHNVTEGLIIGRKMSKARAEEKARAALEKVGMLDRADYYPHQLSGGQQQRVAIARALATDPEIIYFDEPTSALDPELTGEVLGVMRQLAKEGMTMLVVTHEMGFARNVSNKVVFMENGVVVEEGPSKEFFANPREERTRTFLQNIEQHYE